jgi:hypothetical protein
MKPAREADGARMHSAHDLAIRWNDNPASVPRLARTGIVPVQNRPKHLRDNGQVAIVGSKNEIRMTFKAIAVEGPQNVTLADGTPCKNGFNIIVDKRTIRFPRTQKYAPFKGFHAIGAFRYFLASKNMAVVVGAKIRSSGRYVDDQVARRSNFTSWSHTKGIPGESHGDPEATLVRQYMSNLGEHVKFDRNYIRSANLYVDLFNLTAWQLIEAKVSTSRESIRMAIGQLRDYKRYYSARHPSLAVLLSSRPAPDCIKLLTDNHISVIWRTARGTFKTIGWQKNQT